METHETRKQTRLPFIFGGIFVAVLIALFGILLSRNGTSDETAPYNVEGINEAVAVQNAFISVVEKVKPAVVHISTTKTVSAYNFRFDFDDDLFDDFFESPFDDFFKRRSPKQQKPKRESPKREQYSMGSGMIINKDGYILTNNHVVDGVNEIKVILYDKSEYTASVIGQDRRTDLAVIKIDAKKELPCITPGDSDRIKVGEWAIAIGNPYNFDWTVTVGVISGKGRSGIIPGSQYEDFLQTSAPINPGNSGGPLVNIKGEVIGINTLIVAAPGAGLGFAIPINVAKDKIIKELLEKGKVSWAWVGIEMQEMTPEIAESLKGVKDGIFVSRVYDNSPAKKSGIKEKDVIISIDGKRANDPKELRNEIIKKKPGDSVTFAIIRDGQEMNLSIKLEEMPELVASGQQMEKKTMYWFGLTVSDITPEIAKQLNLKDNEGVVILDIEPKSPASGKLQVGDIIKEIEDITINNTETYDHAVSKYEKKQSPVLFKIKRGNDNFYIALKK